MASDVHGLVSSADIISEIAARENVDMVVLLGDLLHGYSSSEDYNPHECKMILENIPTRLVAVKGNCDFPDDGFSFDMPLIQSIYLSGHRFVLTHGHELANLKFNFAKGDIICFGHTHVPLLREDKNGVMYVNPGSISQNRDNNSRTYILIDNQEIRLYEISGKLLELKMIC